MTRVTRSSGVKPDIDIWNLDELPKTRPAAKTSRLLTKKCSMKIPDKEREKDMRALHQAAKEYEKNTAAVSRRVHEIAGIPTSRFPAVADPEAGEGQDVTSMGLAVVMASRRYRAPSIALAVARCSSNSIGGGSVAIDSNATTAGGSAASGGDGGGGGCSSGDVQGGDRAGPAEPDVNLEGPARGSLKRALDDDGQGGDSSPQEIVEEERARKRVRLNTCGAGNGGGGGGGKRARGGRGGGGSGARVAGPRSNSDSRGEEATLSGAATRATRKSGIPPITSLWDLPDLPKSRAAAKSAPLAKAYMSMCTGERPQKERDDEVSVRRGGATRGQDRGTRQIPAPARLVTEYPTPIASTAVSSLQAKAMATPQLVSTRDGETRDATTGKGDSGISSSRISSDGNAAAPPAPPSTGDGRWSRGSVGEIGDSRGSSSSSSSSSDGGWGPSGRSTTTAGDES